MNPDLTMRELWLSGSRRDMMGTDNTLILAFQERAQVHCC